MALDLTLEFTSETPDDDIYTGVLTDSTTYGTGGNPARADGVLYLTGEKLQYDSSVAHEITIATYDPESATTFSFDIEEDGWYRFRFIFIPDYDNGETYLRYDAVYDNDVVYRATANNFSGQAPPNVSYWEVISDPTDLVDNDGTSTESANVAIELFQIIIYPFAKKLYGDFAEDFAIKSDGTFEDLEQFTAYKEIGAIVAALKASNTRERYASGERIARYAATLNVV